MSLAAIVRDEGNYCIDWVVHHHVVGFDQFIIVLHKCVDDTEVKLNLLKERLGLDIKIHHCTSDGPCQMGTYKWILEQYGHTTDWLLFLDSDEYVYCTNPGINYREDIKVFLRQFDKKISGVSIHGKVFGPCRQLKSPGTIDVFRERLPLDAVNHHSIKTFIRPKQCLSVLSPHIQNMKGKVVRTDGSPLTLIDGHRTIEPPIFDPVCFDHYYTRSAEDWVKRYTRGSCNDPRPNHAYGLSDFLYYSYNMEYDNSIGRYYYWKMDLFSKIYGNNNIQISEQIKL